MTSLELVDFINLERSEKARAAGVAFPSKGHARLEHSDFMKNVVEVLGERAGNFSATYQIPGPNGSSRSAPCCRFPKREACLMAMSYSYDLQAKVFDRMTALEDVPYAVPNSFSEALRLAAWASTARGSRNATPFRLQAHCKGAAIYRPLETAGGLQEVCFLAESDMFRLMVNSTFPAADALSAWGSCMERCHVGSAFGEVLARRMGTAAAFAIQQMVTILFVGIFDGTF